MIRTVFRKPGVTVENMRSSAPGKERRYLLVLASAAAILTFECYARLDVPNLMSRLSIHNMILNGTAPSPYRYRVLVPLLTNVVGKLVGLFVEEQRVFELSYLIYDYGAIAFSLLALYALLRLWFSPDQALSGTLFSAVSMIMTFRDNYYQPWSLMEPGTLALGLYLIQKRKDVLFAFLVLIASLNRETGIILPFAYMVTRIDFVKGNSVQNQFRTLARSAVYGVIWIAVFYGLRALRGSVAQIEAVSHLVELNLRPELLALTLKRTGLLLGAYWGFAFLGYWYAPTFVKRSAMDAT